MNPDDVPTVTITVALTTVGALEVTAPADDHRVALLDATGALRVTIPGRTILFAPEHWSYVNTEVNP